MKIQLKENQIMKTLFNVNIWIAIGCMILSSNAYAQQTDTKEQLVNNLGKVFYIKPADSWKSAKSIELETVLKRIYGIRETFKLELISTEQYLGKTKELYYQTYNGVKVETGDIIVHRAGNGEIEHLIGTLQQIEGINVPRITADEAYKKANVHIGDKYRLFKDLPGLETQALELNKSYDVKPILTYVEKGGQKGADYVLCYKVELMTTAPALNLVYINAVSGEIEMSYNGIHSSNGSGNSLYRGTVNVNTAMINANKYYLHDSTRNIFTLDADGTEGPTFYEFKDSFNTFRKNNERAGVDVHYGMTKALDYYKDKHQRSSYDNAGAKVINVVHYDTLYDNAFWNGRAMFYGDGNGVSFTHWVGVDIVGHEFSHAVVEKTAGLVYRHESGAINESIADIFGSCIQSFEGRNNWTIGEDNYITRTPRNMDHPERRSHPAAHSDPSWTSVDGCVPSNGNDQCGVHSNSGVGNYWFYLLTDGKAKTTNTVGKEYEVTAIGRDKAAELVYIALTQYMTSGSDYQAFRKATLLAAEDKYGKKSNEYKQVCNAWYGVNVGEKCCADSVELDFDVKDATCPYKKDGEIKLTVLKTNGPFIYKWYKGDTTSAVLATSKDLTGIDTGNYVVWVKDTVAKCEVVDKTKVDAPKPVKVSISGGGIQIRPCDRRPEIYLQASASGGVPPYEYNWTNGRKLVASEGSVGASGYYTAVATDKNKCIGKRTTYVFFIPILCSYDPNDIVGPPSYGDEKFVSKFATLPYKVRFENDPDFATAPASKVTVDLPLDSNFDFNSFRLSDFGFNNLIFKVPSNSTSYYTRLDLKDSMGIYVDVTAGLDISAQKAFWIFESIDPVTGLPPTDGNRGFLPVNDTAAHNGEGFVDFTIKPKSATVTGDSLRAKGEIVFDQNPSIFTPRTHNIIDAVAPTSAMDSLPSVIDSTQLTFTFKGIDDVGGSGVGGFDIYISENKAQFALYAQNINDSSLTFNGNSGSTYEVYSLAYDNVNNKEAAKNKGDISFTIRPKDFLKPLDSALVVCVGDTLNIGWKTTSLSAFDLLYSTDSSKTYHEFATNLSASDSQFRWVIPAISANPENIRIKAVLSIAKTVLDSSIFFMVQPSPVIDLGKDTFYCDGLAFNHTLNAGSGFSSYLWDDNSSASTRIISTQGTYSVKVTNSFGCVGFDELITTKKLNPTVAVKNVTHLNCFDNNIGAISTTIVSGNPPFTYLWNNAETTSNISGLTAGRFILKVTDSLGCVVADTTDINSPSKLVSSNTFANVKCKNGNDGSIDLTVSGGTTPYTYVWSNAATSQDLTNLTAGKYVVTITDGNNCTLKDSATITEPTLLVSSIVAENVKCKNGNNGSIDLSVSGGTTPYTYVWSNAATSQDLASLTAGKYVVTITDGNNCVRKDSVEITEPTLLTSSITPTHVKCKNGNNGSIDLTISGGTTPYTYVWSNAATSQDLSNLTAGKYVVTVTDGNNCTLKDSVVITEPTLLVSSNTFANVKCKNGNDGSIDLTVSGGTTPYTYVWSNAATSQDLTNLTAGKYVVTITDGNNCTLKDSATITEPTLLVSSIVAVNVKCKNGNNGSIDLSVSGGTTPYTYVWSNAATSQDLTNLTAGKYVVTITDGNNCVRKDSVEITEPTLLTSSITPTHVKCKNGNNGSIDLTITGGTTPYTYVWSNAATSQDLSNLTAGKYVVTVTDGNNCTIKDSVVITEPTLLVSSNTFANVKCKNGNDGSIDLTVSGGTTPYTYVWSNAATSQDLTNLTAGKYVVTITDGNNCTLKDSATITEPTLLVSSIVAVNVKCKNGNNGSIDLSVSGGTTPYTYVWSNAATSQDLTNLTAGKYVVTITDGNNCVRKDSVVITEPTLLTSSITPTHVKCKNGNNGSIDLTITGGTTPYTYVWSNAATSQDLSNLTAGKYVVTVTDGNNCTIKDSVVITEPTLLVSSNTFANVKCKNGNDGSIDLTVSGGTTPYTYVWSNAATSQDLTNLTAGKYLVTITDGNNCTLKDSATITEPTLLVSSIVAVNVKCKNGNNASIDLTVSGGTTPYTYVWSNAATSQDLTSLTAGKYVVTITDGNNCVRKDSVEITEPTLLQVQKNSVAINCFGGNDGKAIGLASGGTTPYTYLWSSLETVDSIVNKVAGTYYLTTTDNQGCSRIDTFVINQPLAPLSIAGLVTDVKCFGGNNGAIDITVNGGTNPYTYNWNNVKITEDISNETQGSFEVVVTDKNNCVLKDTFVINQPTAPLLASFSSIKVKCFGGSDGAIDMTVSGGTLPYTFIWSNSLATEDLSGLMSGWYKVIIKDKNDCELIDSVFIDQPNAPLSVNFNSTDVNCFGGNDGNIITSVNGGTTPYSFNWNRGDVTKDLPNATTGKYILTISDSNNCVLIDSVIINQPVAAIAVSFTVKNVDCHGSNTGAVTTSITGGTPNYSFNWTGGLSTQNIATLFTGWYKVIITDANLCTLTDSVFVDEPNALATTTEATTATKDAFNGRASVVVAGGTPPYTYLWNDTKLQTDDTARNLKTGIYIVEVVDFMGCIIRDTVEVGEAPKIEDIHLFPNPTSGKVVVTNLESLGLDELITLTLLETNGKELTTFETIGNDRFEFTIGEEFTSGFYYIRIANSRGTQTRRVFLNK
jgi:Zn-dependent metalloprotease